MPSKTTTVKDEARRLIDRLADDATWADLKHALYAHELIQRGLDESDRGETGIPIEELRREYGLDVKVVVLPAARAELREIHRRIAYHSERRATTSLT